MSVAPTDILSSLKNVSTALGNYTQIYSKVQGTSVGTAISTATLLKSSSGRVASVSVTTAGSAVGAIYDATTSTATTNPIYVIPTTVGIYVVNLPVNNGVVVAPGTGQVVTVSYS
jgi:hypothetical protein